MAHTFELYEDNADEYRWRLRASNGRIVADSSEGYDTKGGARQAATRVQEYLPEADLLEIGDAAFEVYEDRSGGYRWRLRARNGEIVADGSESYESRSGAVEAVQRFARTAPDAR